MGEFVTQSLFTAPPCEFCRPLGFVSPVKDASEIELLSARHNPSFTEFIPRENCIFLMETSWCSLLKPPAGTFSSTAQRYLGMPCQFLTVTLSYLTPYPWRNTICLPQKTAVKLQNAFLCLFLSHPQLQGGDGRGYAVVSFSCISNRDGVAFRVQTQGICSEFFLSLLWWLFLHQTFWKHFIN